MKELKSGRHLSENLCEICIEEKRPFIFLELENGEWKVKMLAPEEVGIEDKDNLFVKKLIELSGYKVVESKKLTDTDIFSSILNEIE